MTQLMVVDCQHCDGGWIEGHPYGIDFNNGALLSRSYRCSACDGRTYHDEEVTPRTLEDLEAEAAEEADVTKIITSDDAIQLGEFELIEQLILSGQIPDDRINALLLASPELAGWLRTRAAERQEHDQVSQAFGGGV